MSKQSLIKGTYKDCPVCHGFKGNHTRISTHMRHAHGMGLSRWEQKQPKRAIGPTKPGKEPLSPSTFTKLADATVKGMDKEKQLNGIDNDSRLLENQMTEIPVNPNTPLADRVGAFMDEALANPEISEEWKRQIEFRRIQLNRIAQMFPESANDARTIPDEASRNAAGIEK